MSAIKTEKILYHTLKKELHDWFLMRIENTLNVGTPDLFILKNKTVWAWVELKVISLNIDNANANKELKVPFRPGQLSFIRTLEKHCKNIMLLCAINNDLFIFHDIKDKYTIAELRLLSTRFRKLKDHYCDVKTEQQLNNYLICYFDKDKDHDLI